MSLKPRWNAEAQSEQRPQSQNFFSLRGLCLLCVSAFHPILGHEVFAERLAAT